VIVLAACGGSSGSNTGGSAGAGGSGGDQTTTTTSGDTGGASDAGSDAPVERYTVKGDTVVDNTTGLTWQRTVDGQRNYTDSGTYCQSLALDGGGWRMPTIDELTAIVDTTMNPTLDGAAFPGTPPAWFWSSTYHPQSSAFAWSIAFFDGHSNAVSLGESQYVRCVR
jgi:hypothetical protein